MPKFHRALTTLLVLVNFSLVACGPLNTFNSDQPSLDPFNRPSNVSHTIRVLAIDIETGEVIRHAPLECKRYGDVTGKLLRVDSLNDDGSSNFLTDVAGNYEITFDSLRLRDRGYESPGFAYVQVDTSGYPPNAVVDVSIGLPIWTEFAETEEATDVMIALALGEDFNPVLGAKIVVIDDPHTILFSGLPSGNLETNEDGKITIPTSSFHGNIFYLRNGDLYSRIMDARIWRGSWDTPVRIFMRPQATLSGQVIDGEGKPMPGIVVRAWLDTEFSNTLSRHTMTDAEGRYHIDGLPPAKYKTAVFRGKYTEFLGKGDLSGDALQKFQEALSNSSPSDALGALADIKMQEQSGARLLNRAIPATPGVVSDEWKEKYWRSAFALGEVVELQAGEKRELSIKASGLIEKEMQSLGALHGRIMGMPAGSKRGVLKISSWKPGAFLKYVETGSSGEFRVENIPSDIPLQLEALVFGGSDFGAFLDELPVNDSELIITLLPKPLVGVSIRDAVNNQPITEVGVTVSRHKPTQERLHEYFDNEIKTTYLSRHGIYCYSGDGRYAVAAHDYWNDQWFTFSKPGYQLGYIKVSKSAVHPNVTELFLSPGHGISGKVQDERGIALRGAQIIVDCFPDIRLDEVNPPLVPVSDTQGAFRLDYLGTKSTHFVVNCNGFAPQYFEIPSPGSSITCTLERGESLTGIVTYDGAPLRKAYLRLSYLEEGPLKGFTHYGTFESDGSYQIDSIRSGRYKAKVEFFDSVYGSLEYSKEIHIPSDTTVKFNVNYDSNTDTWSEI